MPGGQPAGPASALGRTPGDSVCRRSRAPEPKAYKKQLMRLCEMLGKFAQECEWNVAVGQVLGAVAAEWEDIL